MANVQRVLVGAENFGSALLPGDPLKKGDIVTVSEEVAANLDVHVWRDTANNPHPVFVDPSGRLAAPYVDQDALKGRKKGKPATTKKSVKKKSARRKKSA